VCRRNVEGDPAGSPSLVAPLRLGDQRSGAPAKAPAFRLGTSRRTHVARSVDAGAIRASTLVLS
jgi:hypothetical protein